jgi:mannosyl-3-phosphoglycerate synthase
MRIAIPRATERLGAVLIHSVQNVIELDAGISRGPMTPDQSLLQRIPNEVIYEYQQKMAIIIPMRSERIRLVEGVLSGIPNHCLTIIVSNSPRKPVDRFAIERDAFDRFSRFVNKRVIIVHQKDPLFAEAFQEAGYAHLIDEKTGLIKDGKAEGMVLGTILARLSGSQYLGFIDADNYFPGAVLEYIREYAAGFALSHSPNAMVRIFWHSKPKVVDASLFFARWGRTSRRTNGYLNSLIAEYTGFETDIIQTGNAGEHAITMSLAMLLGFSTGYSIEPFHFMDMFEKFGGLGSTPIATQVLEAPAEIYQIESRNPHLHDAAKGDEHIGAMTFAAMQAVYDSPICPTSLKKKILKDMRNLGFVGPEEEPPPLTRYPALLGINEEAFVCAIQNYPYTDSLFARRNKS